jgi:hypothetical protein
MLIVNHGLWMELKISTELKESRTEKRTENRSVHYFVLTIHTKGIEMSKLCFVSMCSLECYMVACVRREQIRSSRARLITGQLNSC